jgi:serine/threonine protein kinase
MIVGTGIDIAEVPRIAQALARHGLVDHRADVYALGAVLWFTLVGRPPFEGATWHHPLRRRLSADIVHEQP